MRFLSMVSIPLIGWMILCVSWLAPAAAGTSFGVNRIRYVEATGTSVENCQSLRDTLSSITDNDTLHRYLVQLEPGLYSCGDQPLVVGAYIALVGSAKEHTRIIGDIDSNLLGVVHLVGSGTVLRDLSVSNQSAGEEQKSIGVSINTVFSSGSLGEIQLRDVEIFGVDLSVYAKNANIEVWGSHLFSGPAQHDSSTNERAFFLYTIFSGVQGTGDHQCRFSGSGSTILDHDCQPLP